MTTYTPRLARKFRKLAEIDDESKIKDKHLPEHLLEEVINEKIDDKIKEK